MILVTGTPSGRQETSEARAWMAAGSRHNLHRRNDEDDSSLTIGRNPQ
jgi:hypothetical protein